MAESHREEIAKLEALYAGNPGGRVFVHLAEAYRKAGEHERARRILDEGLARHHDSASGYVVLGRVLADMQITGEAEIAFRRVLELDGGNLVALRWLGDLARQAGRNAEAAGHYRELLVRNPSNEEVRDLVEIVERSDPAARPADRGDAAEEPTLTDWAAPSTDETVAEEETVAELREDPAVAEPISAFEESAVTPPHLEEPKPADITPWSAAPGHTEDTVEAPVEYGVVDIDALPGDAVPREHAEEYEHRPEPYGSEEPQEVKARRDYAEPPRHEADADLVATWDSDGGDVLELDELSRDDEAEPMEIHLLDPSYEPADDETEELAVELDIMDLSRLAPEEDEGEYADDDFLADLVSVPQDETDDDDLASVGTGSPFTLTPPEPEPAAAADASNESHEAMQPPAPDAADVIAEGPYDVIADEPYDVEAEEAYDVAAESWNIAADEQDHVSAADSRATAAEDLAAESTAGSTELSELAGAAEPASESHDAATEASPAPETGLVTETMAVLYRTQGFHDRAADVYRALLRQRPGDERLAARLREAEEAAGASTVVPEPEEEDTGEVWLRGVGAAWPGAAEEAEAATPYTWTAAPEEAETGEPISDYLRELVAWKGGQGRWVDAAQAPSPAPVRGGPDADASPPDWLVAGDDAAMPWADAAVEEVASWSTAQLSAEDAQPASRMDAPEPRSDDNVEVPSARADELPADPWLQGPPAAEDTPQPASEAGEFAAAESPDVAESSAAESGAGWTPFELDRDIPAAAPASSGPAEVPPPAVSLSPDDDPAEDEDLEMFRSWLQSLKK